MKFPGWVNELIGGQHSGAKGFMFFGVNVDLTESGIGSIFCCTCAHVSFWWLFLRYLWVSQLPFHSQSSLFSSLRSFWKRPKLVRSSVTQPHQVLVRSSMTQPHQVFFECSLCLVSSFCVVIHTLLICFFKICRRLIIKIYHMIDIYQPWYIACGWAVIT